MKRGLLSVVAAALLAGPALAQQPPPAPTPLAVGAAAPLFTLPSATRGGVGPNVSIEDYKNQIIVLAFFFRARTSG